MSYKKIGWEDYPSVNTPINAENLNHMDEGIADLSKQMGDIEEISNAEIDAIMNLEISDDLENSDLAATDEDIDSLF